MFDDGHCIGNLHGPPGRDHQNKCPHFNFSAKSDNAVVKVGLDSGIGLN